MQSPGTQTFYRGSDRILGGVCSGLAEGFHTEVLWVRVAFVVLAFLQGVGVLLYIVLWVLMPERAGYQPLGQNVFESMSNDVKRALADLRAQFSGARRATESTSDPTPPPASPATSASGQAEPSAPSPAVGPQSAMHNPSFIFGAFLIVLGIAFLAANSGIVTWGVIWPAALVVLGIGLLVRNKQTRP
jgi:phage shock protein C